MVLRIRDNWRSYFPELTVEDFLAIPGEVYREAGARRTRRFERNGRTFFIKCHFFLIALKCFLIGIH